MSVEKIKGIETEWSIVLKNKDGVEPAETHHFKLMINVIREYLELPADSWEGFVREIENVDRVRGLDNALPRRSLLSLHFRSHRNLLPNGGRLYIDGPHLEYSTPECLSARTLVAADRAGEAIIGLARKVLNEELTQRGAELLVFKDNTDRRGNSYGCHENYLVSRQAFNRITNPASLDVGYLASFFICRLLFTGSGKMGIELNGKKLEESDSVFQISQRADFMETLLSGCTVTERGLVNTRDEPYADSRRFGRLHVICGDANLAEVANYMKVGVTSIILKMIEDGFLEGDIIVIDPVQGIKLASQDLTCKMPLLETLGGRKLSSLDLLEEYSERIQAYLSRISQPLPEDLDLASKLVETVSDFRTGNKARLRRRFDWQIKLGMFEDFLEEHGFSWGDLKNARFQDNGHTYEIAAHFYEKDILYHNIDKEKGLYWAAKEDGDIEELVSREDVINLIKNPPSECRSYFRGRCIAKFFESIAMADWDEIAFKDKDPETGKNFSIFHANPAINLGNPIWGSRDDTEGILSKADSFSGLIAELKKIEQ